MDREEHHYGIASHEIAARLGQRPLIGITDHAVYSNATKQHPEGDEPTLPVEERRSAVS